MGHGGRPGQTGRARRHGRAGSAVDIVKGASVNRAPGGRVRPSGRWPRSERAGITAGLMTAPIHIVWFKRDLRIADHGALAGAAERAATDGGVVLPLYVVEPGLWAGPDMAARHWGFVADSLAALRADLAALGQPLVVRVGEIIAVLDDLCAGGRVAGLYAHQETGNGWTFARDRRVRAWAKARGLRFDEPRQSGVIRSLAHRDGWAARWDRFMAQAPWPTPGALQPVDRLDPGTIPTADALGLRADPCPQRQPGGARAGLDLLDSFLDRRGRSYRWAMSSPVTAFDACSRLSPHLAWGTLSVRQVAQRTWAAQRTWKAETGAAAQAWRQSLRSFSARLHWHCHFAQKLEDAPRLEVDNLHRGYDGLRPDTADPERLAAWAEGRTGLPFVDACMRALRDTGYLNFRMRAMVQAVATYHLWLPWRDSGLVLARRFTDYDPGIHWPQAQMQAGTTGINTVRIYNPVKQGYDQDADGRFIRRWVPELAAVPDAFVHEPWRWDGAATLLGRGYPAPVVDHQQAARAARERVHAVRRSAAFRDEADRIQTRHGSRRSGLRQRGGSNGPRAPATAPEQGQFDFDAR